MPVQQSVIFFRLGLTNISITDNCMQWQHGRAVQTKNARDKLQAIWRRRHSWGMYSRVLILFVEILFFQLFCFSLHFNWLCRLNLFDSLSFLSTTHQNEFFYIIFRRYLFYYCLINILPIKFSCLTFKSSRVCHTLWISLNSNSKIEEEKVV